MTEPGKPVHAWTAGVLQHTIGHIAGTLIIGALALGFGIATVRAFQPADDTKCFAIYRTALIEPSTTYITS